MLVLARWCSLHRRAVVVIWIALLLGVGAAIELFALGLASAVFIDALIIGCVLLPAVLQQLGPRTSNFPSALDRRLPRLALEHAPAPRAAPVRAAIEEG